VVVMQRKLAGFRFVLGAALSALCVASCSGGSGESGAAASGSGGSGAGGDGAGAAGSTGAFGIDECAEGRHDCAMEADCIDTPGFYECACKAGYKGDGKSCVDVDECAALLYDCDSNAACTNEAGSYSCACRPGFEGDGKMACDATYTAVSVGQYHGCAVRSDKKMWCWGLNTSGQVGTGTGDAVFVRPAAAGDAADYVDVSVGAAFSCALNESGAIICWGANNTGQLGDGSTNTSTTPKPVADMAMDFVALDAGTNHACAIRMGGELACWGTNNRGQVGDGSNENRLVPTAVSAGPWLAVSAGLEFTCAVKGDHTLWCWGLNSSRQLGDGTTTNSAVPLQEKTLATDWASVSAGNGFACGVKQDGTRWCWGANSSGQGGDAATASIVQPKAVDADTDWATVNVGEVAGCGLRTNGSLWCWGDGSVGQTGQPGAETLALSPVQVGADTDWIDIAGGLRFACGIRAGGKLLCWGSASRSAIGLGYTSDRLDPSPVGSSTEWADVDVQLDNGCAIRKNGDLYCWGRNVMSNLGDGSNITRVEPTPVGAGKVWKRVAVGRTHTCGLAEEGGKAVPFCWGADFNGELGNGAAAASSTPTLVSATAGNESPWVDLAAGLNHTCGVRQDGTLWCWGRNTAGQLGDGTNVSKPDPKQVLPAGAQDWKEVAASGEYTCARRATGAVLCWGRNDNAQLGLGNVMTPVMTPTQVAGTFAAIDAGGATTCAVAMDGALFCWGRNANGEVGVGNTANPVMAVTQVGVDKDWARPVLGQGVSACALKKSGDLYCWGFGGFGQLGLGSTAQFTTPQKVPSVGPWLKASFGNEHACGVRMDGQLLCWGGSYYAQLGIGVPFVSTPTRVVDP
jgi:alpha-tubulin suppressor-like RCC1 family protein